MSTDLHRLRKIDGRWKIVERSILGEGSFALKASEAPLEDRRARQELLEKARNGR